MPPRSRTSWLTWSIRPGVALRKQETGPSTRSVRRQCLGRGSARVALPFHSRHVRDLESGTPGRSSPQMSLGSQVGNYTGLRARRLTLGFHGWVQPEPLIVLSPVAADSAPTHLVPT